MERLPKRVDFLEVERKWERLWEEWGIYRFDWEDETRPVYVIDTPPPYPSGDFHMGNVLNWTYIDIAARYKRMRGYNVLFPQGWDCHGLPTEVATEKAHNIRRSDVPPDEFRRLCEEWVSQYIDIMKQAIIRLGCSVDWSTEYRTMDPRYWRKTQLSFVLLYRKGLIYRGEHPINWCPRCETAIADAEVEHRTKKGRLAYIRFGLREGHLLIATTRPEYIPACVAVAVHPEDERYRDLIGEKAVTPLFHREVEIVADEEVDPSFGTGAMMICTYGDKADVSAVARLNLPVIKLVDERGRVTEAGGKYAGMTVEEAREAILEDLREEGLLERVEEIDQDVGVCWRCKTPIEILVKEQWFMRTKALTEEVVKTALEIKWFPDYMKYRLIDWA
ncbi:class I tRNA ligase family protein, partial [Candidatus Bathyarchaeota archaeon]|nr:class I tRNA ligase family protein [Candidatus Bathyarchaeota archaeon]